MTIEFNKDNKLAWTLLKKEQAPAYIKFLEMENLRHAHAVEEAIYAQNHLSESDLMKQLWQSAIDRHFKDIESTKTRIMEVKHWFGMEDEMPDKGHPGPHKKVKIVVKKK